jgi:hypothetical protein
MVEVDDRAVEAVGDRRAVRAPGGVVGPEHEVVDEQLRASLEQAGKGRRALVGLETVLLADPDPGSFWRRRASSSLRRVSAFSASSSASRAASHCFRVPVL